MKKRNINIEVLRIISMLMIVYHHFSVHSDWNFPQSFSKRAYLVESVGNFGKIGVIIFVLITGYFSAGQTLKLKKILRLSNNVRFYTLLAIVVLFVLQRNITMNIFISSLFPLVFQEYWFITNYVILILFQPLLASFFKYDKEKKLKYFCTLTMCLYLPSIVGTFLNIENYFIPDEMLAFLLISFAGHLLHEYNTELCTKYVKIVRILCVLTFILVLLKPILMFNFANYFAFSNSFLTGVNSLNALLFSCTFFVVVQGIRIPESQLVLSTSLLVFDVYLIHDNSILRPIIWKDIFKNSMYFNSKWLPIIVIFEPLLVFICCLLIAKIKQFLTKILYFRFLKENNRSL